MDVYYYLKVWLGKNNEIKMIYSLYFIAKHNIMVLLEV